MQLFFQLLLVLFLIVINGFFVASEFSLVSIRKTRIDELVRKKNKSAKRIQNALDHLDHYISATQLGITLVSLALGWIGEPIVAQLIEPLFIRFPENVIFLSSHLVAMILGFIIITFVDIVLGELVPKNISLQTTEKVAFFIITPLIIFTKIFQPFIWLLYQSGSLILRLLGFSGTLQRPYVHSEDEIKIILSQSAEGGAIEQGEAEMVYKVFKLADMPVKNIMIPEKDIIAFSVKTTIGDIIKNLKNNSYSRFPVYDTTINKILGFIHVKDIYKLALSGKEKLPLYETSIIRHIIRVPETKHVDDVLLMMRKKRIHLALVHNEEEKTVGIVTLEDLLESVVGEIHDEFESKSK